MSNNFLQNLLRPKRLTHIVDVGANPIEGAPPYKKMLDLGLCEVTGFEPQASALIELNSKKSSAETYLPYALGTGEEKILNICQYSGWTSLLSPRQNALKVFSQFQSNATVVQTQRIKTHRLDDISELRNFDLLKIDIQGSELDVFKNGENHLMHAVAIQTEVSFVTLYENQHGFGEVDVALRTLGFVPHCFNQVKTWPVGPLQFSPASCANFNQLLEADIVYVKDFIDPVRMDDEQLKHLSMLMHHCYGSVDLSARCIQVLEQRGVISNGVSRYVEYLNQ